jgi:diacylglycerol O-acyltransferase / wax synthase
VPDPLSPADRASLAAEVGPVNMSVGALLVFERGEGTRYDALAERLRSRLHLLPRYRQRLEEPARGLANPVWVDDEAFDLSWHLRAAALPDPRGPAELGALVAREMSRRLDRSRPLWEFYVVQEVGRHLSALVAKMHHALVDGIAALDIGTVLLDPSPEPLEVPAPEEEWQAQPYDRRRHLARLAAAPFVRGQRVLMESAERALDTSPRRAADDMRRATDVLTQLARTRPSAPPTPLNAGLTPNRRFATAQAPLAGLKAVGKAAGGTVNDALLAVVAGMLGRYLDAAGVRPERDPVALVPVSVRREDERGQTGNRISTVLIGLPVAVEDPTERIARVAAETREIKSSSAVQAGALLAGATGWAPPLVSSMLVRAMGGVLAFNLVVSNVPGPRQPFYLNGCRLLELYPVVPLNPPNQGLTVGIVSYDGGAYFGLLADRDLDPPLDVAARALEESLGELV